VKKRQSGSFSKSFIRFPFTALPALKREGGRFRTPLMDGDVAQHFVSFVWVEMGETSCVRRKNSITARTKKKAKAKSPRNYRPGARSAKDNIAAMERVYDSS